MSQAPVDIIFRLKDRASRPAVANMRKLNAAGQQLRSTMLRLGGAMAGAFGVAKLVAFSKESVRLANVQAEALRKVDAVVQATGGAAGFSTDQLAAMASELQNVTTYGDEAILATQAVLLTFRQLTGEEFKRTTELAYDLATVLGQDAKSAALQLGKALNDPAKGLSKLQRVGITFTDAQKAQVDAMVAMGDVAGAQGVILDELANQVGGAARAMREDYAGAVTALGNSWGDLREQWGEATTRSPAVVAALAAITDQVASMADKIGALGPVSGDTVAAVLIAVKHVGQAILGIRHVINVVHLGFLALEQVALETFDSLLSGYQRFLRAINVKGIFDASLRAMDNFRGGLSTMTDVVRDSQAEQIADLQAAQATWEALGSAVDQVVAKVRAADTGEKLAAPNTAAGAGGPRAVGVGIGSGASQVAVPAPLARAWTDPTEGAAEFGALRARIEWEAYARAMAQLSDTDPTDGLTDQLQGLGLQAQQTANGIVTGFGSAFARSLTAGQNFADQMTALFDDMVSNITSLLMQSALGSLVSLFLPGAAGFLPTLGGLFTGHQGGQIPAGPVTAHSGIRLDREEVFLKAKRGERVLDPDTNRDLTDYLADRQPGGPQPPAADTAINLYLDGDRFARWIARAGADGRLAAGRYRLVPVEG